MLPETIELELTGMAFGGSAVGRWEGLAVFVPYALPGERVRARIVRRQKRFAHAELVEVLSPAPERTAPRCQWFARCGGCHWQHINYAAQLTFKRQLVLDQLRRIGGFTGVDVRPALPSPDEWSYRAHATFHLADDRRPGFVGADNHTVIAVDECHIIRPELLAVLNTSTPRGKPGDRVRYAVDETDVTDMAVRFTVKARRFQVSAGSFFQVNLPQAAALVDLALECLALTGREGVLDLYSGVGLFSAFVAERAAHVTAVESYPPAVQDALVNLSGFDNIDIVEGAVEEALAELEGTYDSALVDPPRAGMDAAALDALIARAPSRLVYVSCDPSTFARDARRLAAAGYDLRDVQPVDMFPQTYHVELVALFTRL